MKKKHFGSLILFSTADWFPSDTTYYPLREGYRSGMLWRGEEWEYYVPINTHYSAPLFCYREIFSSMPCCICFLVSAMLTSFSFFVNKNVELNRLQVNFVVCREISVTPSHHEKRYNIYCRIINFQYKFFNVAIDL